MYTRKTFILTTLILLLCIASRSHASNLTPAGWIEKATLYPDGISLHAKLDTGAKTTSINAPKPEFFDQGGNRWVRFTITSKDDDSATIEAPVVREATIKRHYEKAQVRPVILLDICIGNVRKKEEVNLVDRSNLKYQLLIGRNFLKNAFLIDSSSTYMLSPECSD